jgi:hypothetical protein
VATASEFIPGQPIPISSAPEEGSLQGTSPKRSNIASPINISRMLNAPAEGNRNRMNSASFDLSAFDVNNLFDDQNNFDLDTYLNGDNVAATPGGGNKMDIYQLLENDDLYRNKPMMKA